MRAGVSRPDPDRPRAASGRRRRGGRRPCRAWNRSRAGHRTARAWAVLRWILGQVAGRPRSAVDSVLVLQATL